MTVGIGEDPFKESGMEVAVAQHNFDKARNSLFDLSAELVAAPREFEGFQSDISEEASAVSETFIELVKALNATGSDMDEKCERIKELWFADEKERKNLFTQLTDCEDFGCGIQDCVGGCIGSAFEAALEEGDTSEEIINKIDDSYSAELKNDVEHLAKHVDEKLKAALEQEPASELTRKQRLVKEAGMYAVDVSKIAVGVAIANLLTRAARRS